MALVEALRELGYTKFKCLSQYSLTPIHIPPSPEELRLQRIERLLYTRNPLIRSDSRLAVPSSAATVRA